MSLVWTGLVCFVIGLAVGVGLTVWAVDVFETQGADNEEAALE